MDEERITDLEIKVSYLEDFVNQLQEVVVEQSKEIAKLIAENKLITDKIREMSESLEGDIPNRKPPHY